MKKMIVMCGAAVAMLAGGCAATKVAVAPVGPNPAAVAGGTGTGQLEVFSALSGRSAGNDPTWWQHSDYFVYNSHSQRIKHVSNAPGYYSSLPRLVTLSAGDYIVKARAKGTIWTTVPVVIKPNEITRVHLDGKWQPAAPAVEVVMAPEGYPVGWKAAR